MPGSNPRRFRIAPATSLDSPLSGYATPMNCKPPGVPISWFSARILVRRSAAFASDAQIGLVVPGDEVDSHGRIEAVERIREVFQDRVAAVEQVAGVARGPGAIECFVVRFARRASPVNFCLWNDFLRFGKCIRRRLGDDNALGRDRNPQRAARPFGG